MSVYTFNALPESASLYSSGQVIKDLPNISPTHPEEIKEHIRTTKKGRCLTGCWIIAHIQQRTENNNVFEFVIRRRLNSWIQLSKIASQPHHAYQIGELFASILHDGGSRFQ